MKLVLGNKPVSARQACRDVFGEGYPNVHRTLGNVYKEKFGESIAFAKKLSDKVRQERRQQLDEEWIQMKKPGNPDWKPYLTPDEEELIVSFLETCNYMHMPFNRDAFKVSNDLDSLSHTHNTLTYIPAHPGPRLRDRVSKWTSHQSGGVKLLRAVVPKKTSRNHRVENGKRGPPPRKTGDNTSAGRGLREATGLIYTHTRTHTPHLITPSHSSHSPCSTAWLHPT